MFRMRVHPDGGDPYEIVAEARDVLAWEKAGRDRAFGDLSQRMRMSDVYALAHVATKRLGHFTGPLQVFEADHNIELLPPEDDGDTDEPGPTERDR